MKKEIVKNIFSDQTDTNIALTSENNPPLLYKDLKTLTNIDRDFSDSSNNFTKKSYSLLYINELLMRLLPKDAAQEDLFILYESLGTYIVFTSMPQSCDTSFA